MLRRPPSASLKVWSHLKNIDWLKKPYEKLNLLSGFLESLFNILFIMLEHIVIFIDLQMLVIRIGNGNIDGQVLLLDELWFWNIIPWLFTGWSSHCQWHFLNHLIDRLLILSRRRRSRRLIATSHQVVKFSVHIIFKLKFVDHCCSSLPTKLYQNLSKFSEKF